jgi:hypothetical protein
MAITRAEPGKTRIGWVGTGKMCLVGQTAVTFRAGWED